MSARKKSTSTEESSSGSSTESTSTSGSESGSDTGSSGSESDSSSSTDHGKTAAQTNAPSRLQSNTTTTTTTANNSKSTTAAFRRKSSETKQQQNKIIPDEKLKETVVNSKTKSTVNRGQRLSKSSVYSSDEENSPVKKSTLTSSTKPQPIQGHKKNIQNDNKKPIVTANTSCGGKAPPAIVKQQQQQHSSVKIPTKQQQQQQQSDIKSKHKIPINDKNKSIFSPDNSSDSDNKEKCNEKIVPKTVPLIKQQKNQTPLPPQPPPVVVKAKQKSNIKKVSVNTQAIKKNDRKRSISSDTASSTEDESSTNSSSHSDDDDDEDDSDSSSHSSPPNKKSTISAVGTIKKQQSNNLTTTTPAAVLKQIVNKSNDITKTVVLSDSDNQVITTTTSIQPVRKQQQTIRKLTRSSSTRKSKHLTGKPSDTDSDIELNKSRSISKSPVKKSSVNIVTKSKTTKVKKSEIISSNSLLNRTISNNAISGGGGDGCIAALSPVPEIQKCPIEGCDSTGHLSGNHNKHFLPEACPIFHNMSTSECKDRTIDRKLREDEQSKIIAHYDAQKIKIPTSEQKMYLAKIRDARARFKPLLPFPMATTVNDKIKNIKHNILDRKREPNLIGLVSDYDLQLFREAQAISSEKIEKEFKDLQVGKGIKYILMGKHQMKVWYQSPYPEDVARIPKMYICEFCLRYQKSEISMKRHSTKCVWRHPPGDEIYRKGKLQVWQVDGKKHKQFCQHLCLLAKFFLDHKTLYYEVEPFLFYVMTLANYEGCHIVGYFSKEKNSYLNYNVSCILTLPPYQRKGYGRLLIDFSYLLTRTENKIGSPEKPLSDLGLISYRSYWKDVLLDFLCNRNGTTLSIKDLSQEMAINSYDIVSTLQALGMMKYWKGKHIVLKKQDVLEEYEERIKRRGNFPKIDASCLRWNPFIPPQTCGST